MNIIEAIQAAENGHCIRNGMLKRIDHFLKYMGGGIFNEYAVISRKDLTSSKELKYHREDFTMAYILSNDWEIFDDSNL